MELRHLRYFQAVAYCLSFSRAAEQLRIAQPAISRQIAALEQELSLKLFIRTTTQVRLTDAGKHFLHEVERLLTQLDIAVTGTQQIARGLGGELNLGVDWRLSVPQIPEAVRRFRAEHPQVTVNFVELTMHMQVEALRAGDIHIAFVHQNIPLSQTRFISQPIHTAAMKAAVSKRHSLAGRRFVALRDLRDQTWIKLDEKKHPGFRAFVVQLCHPALFTPKFGQVANSLDGLLALVGMDDGICVLPSSLIPHNHPELSFLDTDCPPFEIHAFSSKETPSESRTRFLEILTHLIEPRPIPRPRLSKNAAFAPPPGRPESVKETFPRQV